MLPNLSQLTLRTESKLFEYVAMKGGGKNQCATHKEPLISKKDEDPTFNCAVDGYLMFKPVVGSAEPLDVSGNSGKLLEVEVDEGSVTLTPLLTRQANTRDRMAHFKLLHSDWIEDTFPIVCDRGKNLSPVTWKEYGEELSKMTDWYYLDKQKRGHLFVQLLDTDKLKLRMHMPVQGVFNGKYLYISLVCAAKGYGKSLMKIAEAAARTLGCNGIALASLSNSAGFYFSQGFYFVNKSDGTEVNVDAWTKTITDANGNTKTILDPEKDVRSALKRRRE